MKSVLLLIHTLIFTSYHTGVKSFKIDATIDTASRFSSMSMSMSMNTNIKTSTQIDKDTSDFHQYAAAAVDFSAGSGHVSSQSGIFSIIRSVRNWDKNQRQNYLYRISLAPFFTKSRDKINEDLMLPPILLDKSVDIYLPSPSGNKTVIIKAEHEDGSSAVGSEKKITERIVEVWLGSSLIRRIPVGLKGTHGMIINDFSGFGSPVWSHDEECLLYSAERISPATFPFWRTDNDDDGNNDRGNLDNKSDIESYGRGGQNVLGQGQSENWGECYSKQEPILDIYILNISTGRLGRVRNVPKTSITLGQAVWHPKCQKIVYTGFDAGQPKRLGMVYCRNRKSKIYESDVFQLLQKLAGDDVIIENENKNIGECNNGYTCVSNDLSFSRSPRFVDETLVFLGSEHAFISHDACMGLFRWLEDKQVLESIVPIIEFPKEDGGKVMGMGFPGLFLGQLPIDCGIDEDYLVTTTLWGSFQRVIRINIRDGDINLIDIPQLNELGSQSICTRAPNGDLIISESSCDQPASLWIVTKEDLLQDATEKNGKIVANAHFVANFSPIAASSFSPVKKETDRPYIMKILSIIPNSIDGATSNPIQAILLLPKTESHTGKLPMVVVPHGGPHSCSTSTFAPGIAYLASKYAVLLPNYRGSIGFGQAPLNSLLSRIGKVDVDDVMMCTRYVIENFSLVDGERVGIVGGSHGGYITASCTSQNPDLFKAAVMRNPVTNIASMITSTDIPDWCLSEVMGEYDQSQFRGPTLNQITKMYEMSPISLVHNVKTPTLIALGMIDLRVPPSQGLEWFHSLRSQGVPTKLLKYPNDCHSLNLVATEIDHWLHIRHWFDKYLHTNLKNS